MHSMKLHVSYHGGITRAVRSSKFAATISVTKTTNSCLCPKRHHVKWSLWVQFYICSRTGKKKKKKKKCFWLCCALEHRAELQQDVLSCCPHPQWVSQQLFSDPAPNISPCSKNTTWSRPPPPHPSAPYPVFLSFSLSFYFWIFKLFYGKRSSFFRKCSESVFPHARPVIIEPLAQAMVRDLSEQTSRKRVETHPDIPLVLRTKGKGWKQVSHTVLAMFCSKHDSCRAV